MLVLMMGRGVGYYDESGYDVLISKHKEYIVPVYKFKIEWLKAYSLDKHKESIVLF